MTRRALNAPGLPLVPAMVLGAAVSVGSYIVAHRLGASDPSFAIDWGLVIAGTFGSQCRIRSQGVSVVTRRAFLLCLLAAPLARLRPIPEPWQPAMDARVKSFSEPAWLDKFTYRNGPGMTIKTEDVTIYISNGVAEGA